MEECRTYDVAIIGGGVVGCAVLRELTSRGLHCVLCETNSQLVSQASSGNSGIVHTGFDAPLNSIELECLQDANMLNESFFQEYDIPFNKVGALIVAWTNEDLAKLPAIVTEAHKAGIQNVRQISATELRQREPHLNWKALGGVYVPDEMVIDPWLFPVTLAGLAVMGGSRVEKDCEVTSGVFENGVWTLTTAHQLIRTKTVINCGGLFGDQVETIHRQSPFTVKPRKGQFAVFSQSAQSLVRSIIYSVPSERTKGVLLYPTVYGNVVIGPTAEEQQDRERAEVDEKVIQGLLEKAYAMVPALKNHEVVGTYAGLRPATQHRDYWIEPQMSRNWVTVGGIRSTGLSACLGIARRVASFLPEKKPARIHRCDARTVPKALSERNLVEGGLEIGGRTCKITHPLTRFGTSTSRGLLTFKAKL